MAAENTQNEDKHPIYAVVKQKLKPILSLQHYYNACKLTSKLFRLTTTISLMNLSLIHI